MLKNLSMATDFLVVVALSRWYLPHWCNWCRELLGRALWFTSTLAGGEESSDDQGRACTYHEADQHVRAVQHHPTKGGDDQQSGQGNHNQSPHHGADPRLLRFVVVDGPFRAIAGLKRWREGYRLGVRGGCRLLGQRSGVHGISGITAVFRCFACVAWLVRAHVSFL